MPFPSSIALIGMRNVYDYRVFIREEEESLGTTSPFNIIDKSLTLNNFTFDNVVELYAQHTSATGQKFDGDALKRVYYWTSGQPWLVNAIAKQIIEDVLDYDYSVTISADHIDDAVDAISKRKDMHTVSLLNKLKENRVQNVIEPMLTGEFSKDNEVDDDVNYCIDIGLLKINDNEDVTPANRLYSDLIIRYLTFSQQSRLPKSFISMWMDDNVIHMTELLKEFQKYWRENSDILTAGYVYTHAVPQLFLQTFLQRVANGNAKINREFSLGPNVSICA
ncbi:MAG: hypothetical protein LBR22_08005 [Desulfovibrio sp.]|nr:hypothetical protein [Desulfovibrio sp.]